MKTNKKIRGKKRTVNTISRVQQNSTFGLAGSISFHLRADGYCPNNGL